MREEDRKKIDEILRGMRCPKEFKCADSGFEDLCKARDFGDEERLHCLEHDSVPCAFAREYDLGVLIRFCHCPLRVYLAKHFNR